jgi:agmatine deiminase
MKAKTAKAAPAATPASLGYAMPAEWVEHEAIWLSWPHDPESFGEGLPRVEHAYSRVIKEIHKTERVELFVTGEPMRSRVASFLERDQIDLSRVRFHFFGYADVWIRDYGPTFLLRKDAPRLGLVRWIFNAWGGKYEELMGDTKVPNAMIPLLKDAAVFEPGIIMEGGSIEVNGAGTVLTTQQCLLNVNRNPGLKRVQIERKLCENLGVTNVVWLGEGVAGDDTDGHIDDIARFSNATTVLCAIEDSKKDPNYEPLKACYETLTRSKDQDGRLLDVIRLPMPSPVKDDDDRRLPASYANFYIGNGVVLAPVFNCDQDDKALEVLTKAFPGRRVAPIPCRDWVRGLGTIHCGSQQQPKI